MKNLRSTNHRKRITENSSLMILPAFTFGNLNNLTTDFFNKTNMAYNNLSQ